MAHDDHESQLSAHSPDAGHEHPHDAALSSEDRATAVDRPALGEGAGTGKILFLDAFSGIAGDMFVGALVDLGVPLTVVEQAVAKLPIQGFHIHVDPVSRSGIVASKFDVHVDDPQPERTYRVIDDMLAGSSLGPGVKELARKIFRRLGEAEAEVHRVPLDDVHFHEVGAIDAIVDIVGAAAGLVHLGCEVAVSPLPMGRGFVHARHGILPLPSPATVSCLQGIPTYPVDLEAELVTPTGAAIVASVATSFVRWPAFASERVGWGSGTQTFADRPNLLRVVLGTPAKLRTRSEPGSHVVLEANVDDITGELASYVLAALLKAGAIDAWAVPIIMKKGRPALTLCALTPASRADRVAAAMLCESTSLGLRRYTVDRIERPRRLVRVDTPYGEIPVKIGEGPYGPPSAKPEFDVCVQRAQQYGVPVRVVVGAALQALPLHQLAFDSNESCSTPDTP